MKDLDQHKKIAVLIDADNAQLSKLSLILEELSSHGHVVTKRAYGDWSADTLKNWKTTLNELAIQPVQQFAYTRGKNATDASMIIDAMDLLYSKKFDAFALVSSDSDFTKLASRLREDEIYVFGFGEQKTPVSFRNACDDFLFTENLSLDPAEDLAETAGRPRNPAPPRLPRSSACFAVPGTTFRMTRAGPRSPPPVLSLSAPSPTLTPAPTGRKNSPISSPT